jgi:hypothetical protein
VIFFAGRSKYHRHDLCFVLRKYFIPGAWSVCLSIRPSGCRIFEYLPEEDNKIVSNHDETRFNPGSSALLERAVLVWCLD